MCVLFGIEFDISDIISIIAAIISLIFAIINIVFTCLDNKREQIKLTIENYHNIADNNGSLWWFYHMSDDEYKEYKFLALMDHDKLRDFKKDKFIELEDKIGALDEYASGINNALYDYKTFEILAKKYCEKRVTPKLIEILQFYKKGSYENIKGLIIKLDNKAKFNDHVPLKTDKDLLLIPENIEMFTLLNEITDRDIEYYLFLEELFNSYLYGDLKKKTIPLSAEQIQKLEAALRNAKQNTEMKFGKIFN